MKCTSLYMSYHKDYGAWIKGDDEIGTVMHPGENFRLCLGKGVSISCRLGWNGLRNVVCAYGTKWCKTKLTSQRNLLYRNLREACLKHFPFLAKIFGKSWSIKSVNFLPK